MFIDEFLLTFSAFNPLGFLEPKEELLAGEITTRINHAH